jgi:hypothetical protein
MNLRTIIDALSLKPFTNRTAEDARISGVYISDLLSDVMANSGEENLWITLQTHMNIVAVASMKKIPAIILVNGRRPEDETLQRAKSEGIAILGTDKPAFETAGKLYNLFLADSEKT